MLNKLVKHYPTAEIKITPSNQSKMIWFFIKEEEKYIGIPIDDLTITEIKLLKTLFPVFRENRSLNTSIHSKKWYDYLFGHDLDFPSIDTKKEYRIIQFSVFQYNEAFDTESWQEAIKALFPHDVIIVFSSEMEGMIIEEKNDYFLSIQELQTFIQTLESDFYFKIHFYVGQYRALENDLKSLFQLEQTLFQFAHKEMSKERIFSLSNVFPLYILKHPANEIRHTFFSTIFDVFKEDRELRRTIKLYIENHSNASLTAKQLYLHRNSLQYRIDKFVEKTGFDLKSFPNTVIVYLACLDFEFNY